MRTRPCPLLLHFLLPLLIFFISPSIAADSLTPATSIAANQTLVSAGGAYKLGFFTPPGSSNTFLGMWYNNIPVQTVVWVANRANPIVNSTGVLTLDPTGVLFLADRLGNVVWNSSSGSSNITNPTAQLLDSGNLVLRGESSSNATEEIVWQSFDHPTDTLFAGMKLGYKFKTGLNRYINSWLNTNDPSPGEYSFKMDPRGVPEFYLYQWSTRIYASGPWNGEEFTGVPDLKSNDMLKFLFVSNPDEAYYTYEIENSSIISRFVMNSSGLLQRYVWINSTQSWSVFWSDPKDDCDDYRACGPYGVCNVDDSPICNCLPGFEPRFPQEWNLRDGSGGCVRKTQLSCAGDGFLPYQNVKLPESTNATVNMSLSLEECKQSCLQNCSCKAYATANVSGGGSGCIIWTDDLFDMRQFDQFGQNLYVRLAAADIPNLNATSSGGDSNNNKLAIILPTISGVLLLGACGFFIWKKKKAKNQSEIVSFPPNVGNRPISVRVKNQVGKDSTQDHSLEDETSTHEDLDLPTFDLGVILDATDSFALANKIGEGGFGPVYMGKLEDGQDIAVKRLSRRSSQGIDEFKNEVKLIAKLQHRNLVRLLGCCIHGEERMLIYEFMHNRSLNTFIFDEEKRAQLSWEKRFEIILGIARGLLYLHQDSRFRIIHRDLKASNILLDREMTPKISDFGIARIFGADQTDAYTRKRLYVS
ncbi:receptor-like serine/threonine-protein kinase SD1-8 isoform X2 [Ananas comosus]|uniref:Receptor-like serine/threonine-protein kinase n=1 Tax=Ananas comosus TaxID=4615 RepID=A0A6P5FDK1_ANACO|nr:receptor-like serine/threonine-protein kinase SD1-8 isoform X2 [Ananas comosus]